MHYERIKEDLKQAMLAKDEAKKSDVRYILGELARNYKEPTDEEVEATLKKVKKMETESLQARSQVDSPLIAYIDSILPEQISEEDVEAWVKENVDFSQLKNKMQAVGMVTKHFGNAVEGKVVSNIIKEKF